MSRPVPLPGHLRPRPRAGTVPEASPALARARTVEADASSMATLDATARLAECLLVKEPDEAPEVGDDTHLTQAAPPGEDDEADDESVPEPALPIEDVEVPGAAEGTQPGPPTPGTFRGGRRPRAAPTVRTRTRRRCRVGNPAAAAPARNEAAHDARGPDHRATAGAQRRADAGAGCGR